MKQLDRQSVLRTFKEYFLISVGLLMYAFAWICILMPAEVMGGGVNGVGLLIYYGTGGPNGGVPLGITFLVINGLFAADQPAGRSQNDLCDPVPFGFARLPAGRAAQRPARPG